MILGFVDTETTGLKQKKGDRIIELALVLYRLTELPDGSYEDKRLGAFVRRINPLREIHPDAQAVHGISLQDLVNEPTWEVVAPDLVKVLNKVECLVGHNLEFDETFIVNELVRVGLEIPKIETQFCTMLNGRWATPNGKLPNLGELAAALDVEFDKTKAHGALYDIEMTAACFFKALRLGLLPI